MRKNTYMSQIMRKNTCVWFRRVGTNFSILDKLGLDELGLTLCYNCLGDEISYVILSMTL